jgi:hypothetical protein
MTQWFPDLVKKNYSECTNVPREHSQMTSRNLGAGLITFVTLGVNACVKLALLHDRRGR